ncbi:BamA/TamA family outer membrane protein [Paracoccus sp. P2]|mgnify:CR=1 FL=1|uniref:BamA/TamA family outer membrane protein n=1 Tax=Paracoccus pantotrophus TaxID=82367 RepID=A0A7H9BS09_PARPN|nr:BamA/TamA family outer membrane protein [Paracoccus pantotrophus]QLH14114.1 BamA/TamA family outer membrane protein [Paracoccus pantotrophus]
MLPIAVRRRPKTLVNAALLLGALALPAAARIYERVEVRGAAFIPPDDIRRTCGALEEIPLEAAELAEVERCLMSTGVFERVSVTGQGDALVIDVTEVEQRPGRIEAAIAWVNDRSLTGTLSYEQYNLLPDTFSAVHGDFSRDAKSFDIGLYRPDAFGPGLHFGIDILGQRSNFSDLAFSVRSHQAEFYLAATPTEATRIEYGIGWRDHRLFGLDADASPLLYQEQGQIEAPFLRLGFSHGDKGKAGGLFLRFEQFLWNLGTSRPTSETRLELASRHVLGRGTLLMLGLDGGMVAGLSGNDTTALDRVFPGGDSFRGFAPRGIGPADGDDFLGGNRHLVVSAEVQRDLGKAMGVAFRGGIFADIGSVWGLDDTLGGRIDDDAHIRSSIGLSLTFDIAQTPVSLYAAVPVRHQPQDERQVFGLSVNARF